MTSHFQFKIWYFCGFVITNYTIDNLKFLKQYVTCSVLIFFKGFYFLKITDTFAAVHFLTIALLSLTVI